jgi:drug/metabolite transporter (DMT)-like permease
MREDPATAMHDQLTRRQAVSGYLSVLLATIIWSGNFLVSRGLRAEIPPVTMAFLRWSTAVLAILAIAGAATWRERETLLRHMPYLALTAFLGITLFNTLVYIAGHTTAALNMALLATSSPVFVLILARILLNEPITVRKVGGIVLAVSGVILLVTDGHPDALLRLQVAEGDIWMVLAAPIFAGYTVLVRKKPPEIGSRAFLCAIFVMGLAPLAPWAVWELSGSACLSWSPAVAWTVLYLGIGPSVASFFLWNRAIGLIGPSRASLVYYSLPLFCGFEAFVLLDEEVTAVHALSAFLVIGGIVLGTRD